MEDNTIKVKLLSEENSCILEFGLSEVVQVDLYKNDTTQLKKIFNILIKDLLKDTFKLELIVNDNSVENKLAHDICKLYIDDLNNEIASVIKGDEFVEVKTLFSNTE